MGFSNGIIAIKGDHLKRAEEIFKIFNYVDLKKDTAYHSWDQASEYLFENYFDLANKEIALRAIWTDNDWTMICDPELVDPTEDAKLENLSEFLNTEIWTFIVQTSSESYSFTKFDGRKVRSFFVSNGKVLENSGNSLPQEKGFNINEKFCIGEISAISKSLDININPERPGNFIVKELGFDDALKAELANLK